MIDCIDCAMLETRLSAASARESARLAELDRLRERTAVLEHDVDAAAAARRHWIRIVCDRCRSTVEVSSTLAAPTGQLEAAMLCALQALAWGLSSRTRAALGGGTWAVSNDDRDLCPTCDQTLHGSRTP